ncbi:uncharacterized protein LOC110701601 [Chenopodium quinoa]|uniref:uncharacterized protein LOC110701601 n=1 Tax=Chenopodium quinoa TaxID=63459 RepID=UPI000B78EFF9|nr:uncharacterized protein LOC110701601 [Chenopodium quinoa]XP_021734921.1 uncharacterized protein LOC110701601 [Chenopodium quinoa]XP_021734922.1 uncharacterized protein LOC110701601 [Chenopodium quinoa]XP_021734923.1 uncharacterized protein LOC110701601 [Chenopodium quinoa]XP_021734925.1 uncharacterized protein LOC110701601 [Chenopodium quinoa]
MSDEGEKTCPLCAEEMDLTDQQLKPCRCGYEICVWCWHHIMDMAEKDESEGRCPACRTAYDKDRIVGMAADCERLVQEVNMEKKHKSHKAKVKTSDSRKQLSSVRVIQRNLVYIVGLPLELADEDLLQHKDYFAQYGKVLKVSISRTSAGTIQQFANNTCSVYITYSKEEESIRCIQSVHGFILDARPLRACFGTTKYCHAWLRNVPCTNPDCLYLHEIGSLEDSFTKDEIISAYTRVQEITGVTNNMQRRAGTLLPPPADDYCNISSAVIEKPSVKNTLTNSASNSKGSPPNSSSGRSGALPPAASWGARVSNCNIPSVSLASSNGSTKQKAETVHEPPVLATIVSNFIPSDIGKKQMSNEDINANQTKSKMENPEMAKKHAGNSSQRNVSEVSSALLVASAGKSVNQSSCSPAISSDVEGGEQLLSTNSLDGQPCSSGKDKGNCSVMDGKIQKLCSDLSSLSTDKQLNSEHSEADRPNGLSLNNFLSPKNQGLQWHESERLQEHSSSTTATTTYSLTAVKEASDVRSDMQASVLHNMSSETEDDFNNQRLRDAIVINQAVIPTSSPLHLLSHLRAPLQSHGGAECAENYTAASSIVNRLTDECLTTNVSSSSVASNGFLDCFVSHTPEQDSSLFFRGLQGSHMGRFDGELPFVESQPALDMGENNIISNILSLDLDSWDDSLTSPQNLAKLLSETEKPEGTVNIAGSFKGQYSNQSRFSFARQEDSRNHLLDMEPSLGNIGQAAKNPPFGQEFHGIRDPYFDRMGNGFGFPHWNIDLSDNLTSGHSIFPTNKLSLSRSQISAPPGFSAPSRPPPPPGFSSHERSDQTYDLMKSGNHVIDTPSFCRNPYQTPPSGNKSLANDIEFIDPAILAVGKGRLPGGINNSSIDMRSNYPVQPSAFENDSRLQLLMQRSLSPHQNLRYTDVRDNFSPPNDAYGFSSRYMDQSQVSNHVPFSQFSLQQPPRNTAVSNGHWDNWSELQSGNDIGIAELLRNERLGNKFYGGYEDAKFRMTNSGDIYNRSFGM